MSQDKVVVVYADLEAMKQHCLETARRLQDTVKMAQAVAKQMNDGALIGDAGEAFANALNGPFTNSVNRLSDKFDEVASDIQGAIDDMKQADGKAASVMG